MADHERPGPGDRRLHPRLVALAELLAATGGPPVAVGVVGLGPGPLGQVALHPLDGPPAEALAGWVAPAAWAAFGIAGPATASTTTGPGPIDRGDGGHVAHLVARTGSSVTALARPGRPTVVDRTHAPGLGRLADACRRALGLATAPPVGTSHRLHALRWVERATARALLAPPLGWAEVVALHPGVSHAAHHHPELVVDLAERVVEVGDAHARAWTWERTRLACAEGRWALDGLAPHHAAWLDDGAFSRWAQGLHPPLADLLDTLGHLATPEVEPLLRAALCAWSVPVAA